MGRRAQAMATVATGRRTGRARPGGGRRREGRVGGDRQLPWGSHGLGGGAGAGDLGRRQRTAARPVLPVAPQRPSAARSPRSGRVCAVPPTVRHSPDGLNRRRRGVIFRIHGTWRSPVAHLNGVQGVAGSNPAVPTGGSYCKTATYRSRLARPTTLGGRACLSLD